MNSAIVLLHGAYWCVAVALGSTVERFQRPRPALSLFAVGVSFTALAVWVVP